MIIWPIYMARATDDEAWRRRHFVAVLDKYSIGSSIPEAYGPRSGHLYRVPDPSSPHFVTIASDEREIDVLPSRDVPSIEDLTKSYYVQAVRSVAVTDLDSAPNDTSDETNSGREEEEEEEARDDIADICENGMPGETRYGPSAAFKSAEDFGKHKKDAAREFAKLSNDLKLPSVIRVCCVGTCVSSATPGSDFCFAHAGLDPKFGQQELFQRCEFVSHGQRCCVPCQAGRRLCPGHSAGN